MRLFIAINFSEPSRRALLEARERLRGLTGGRGGFTQDTNLHLTLAFLDEVEQGRAKAAEEAMRAAQGRALTLVIDRAGRFPREGGDIWWAGSSSAPRSRRISAVWCASSHSAASSWKSAAFTRTSRSRGVSQTCCRPTRACSRVPSSSAWKPQA